MFNLHATLSCINESLGNRFRCEGIRMAENFLPGSIDLFNNRFSGAAMGMALAAIGKSRVMRRIAILMFRDSTGVTIL